MAIKMRRGADADFRPEKMQPGELAVTVDGTRKVYAAFAAGDVKELSSKEDVDKTIASGLQSLETSTNNKLQSLEKKASSAVDKISSENHRVQEELSRYEYYTKTESDLKYTVAPRKEASSANGELKLTDADDGLSYLELQGNSEQYTATGTNLFDVKQLVKNMQGLQPEKITLMQDSDGKFMRITNNYWHNGRLYTFVNDITKSYKLGFKGRFVSGGAGKLLISVKFKDGTIVSTGAIINEKSYTAVSMTIPAGKEVDYMYFTYGSDVGLYDVLLDSFYLYPEDAPSSEKPTGGYGTPSPEYPSEVRSVGDIPKDVNGVEIRNLLDEEWIKSQPESAWTKAVSGSNTQFRLKLGNEIMKKVTVTAFLKNTIPSGKSFSFTLGNQVGMNGASLVYNNAILKGTADYTAETYVNLYITVNGTTTATHSQMLEIFNYFNFMVTSAAEIDEYRPYIGENNGLVKLESQGVNHVDVNNVLTNMQTITTVNEDGSRIKSIQDSVNGTSRYVVYFNYKKNTQYSLYCRCWYEGETGQGASLIQIRDAGGASSPIQQTFAQNVKSDLFHTFNTGDNSNLSVWIYVQSVGGQPKRTMYVEDLMIVEGEKTLQEMKALKYQPYHQQITWIPLREPLQGMYGLYDTIDKNGYVTQRYDYSMTRLRDCVGISGWRENAFAMYFIDKINTARFVVGGLAYSDVAYVSNQATAGKPVMITTQGFSSVAGWYFAYYFLYGYLGIDKDATDTANKQKILDALGTDYEIKTWYRLIDPIIYQIPTVYIETYEPETNVRCLNKVKPSDMTLDYKIAMSSLIKRLEALESKTVQEV